MCKPTLTLLDVVFAIALSTSAVIGAPTPSENEAAVLTAAEAKVRIWTAILIDAETQTPLERIPVEVHAWKTGHRTQQRIMFTSGSAGQVKIPLAAGTSTFVQVKDGDWWTYGRSIVGQLPPHLADANQPTASDPATPVMVRLWKGTQVRGQLLKPDGTPAAGIALQVGVYINHGAWRDRLGMSNYLITWDHGDWPNWQTTAITRDDGSFSIAVPPPSARSWVRVGTAPGGFGAISPVGLDSNGQRRALVEYAPFDHKVKDDVAAESQDRLDLGKLQLQNGVVLKGRVVDADGKPLAGVRLLTASKHGPYAGRSTESAANGSFVFLPMHPGKITLSPEARLRDAKGEVNSRDVQAVFARQEVPIPDSSDPVNITVQAEPHVTLEFEWVDRRAKKGPISYYGEFPITGKVHRKGQQPVWWRGDTEKTTRDGRDILYVKVPATLADATLILPADQVVTASYKDEQTESGPGRIPLGDITKPRRRIIHGDEPRVVKE